MLSAFDSAGRAIAAVNEAIWIDLQEPSAAEIALVTDTTGLHVPGQSEVSEIETSSRLIRRGDVLYLSMPLITIADGPRVVSAGFVLTAERLITVRFARSLVFDGYKDRLARREAPRESGAHVLVGLLNAIIDRQADAMEKIHADLDNISHRVFSLAGSSRAGRKAEDRLLRNTLAELGGIGDLMSHIRETRLGAARLLPFIEANTADWLPADLRPKLTALHEDIVSVSEFDNQMSDKLQFLLDATLGFINIAQNDVIKVLTIASTVGIPPVLIAGVYGMNFKNIPEYDWAWGYQFGWAMIVLTALIPLLLFRWRKWI